MAEQPTDVAVGEDTLVACLLAALEAAGISLDGRALTRELSLDHDLGLDSFQLMQVARHLEKAYDFKFSVADWVLREEEQDVPAYTVGGLVAFALAELGRAPGEPTL